MRVRSIVRRIFLGPEVPLHVQRVRLRAIRAEMDHPDPFERPDYPAEPVAAEPERVREHWRREAVLRACWRT